MERKLGSIRHNDTAGARVTLYAVDGSPNVWACDDGQTELYDTRTPIDRIRSAWGGPAWDLRLEPEPAPLKLGTATRSIPLREDDRPGPAAEPIDVAIDFDTGDISHEPARRPIPTRTVSAKRRKGAK